MDVAAAAAGHGAKGGGPLELRIAEIETELDAFSRLGGQPQGGRAGGHNRNGGSSWLGGVSIPVHEDINVTYITTAGNFGWRGEDGYSHSIVTQVTLTEKLNYVLQSDLVRADSRFVPAAGAAGAGPFFNDDSVGVNQYFFYNVNDIFSVGSRWEWWKGDGISHYAGTYGVNIQLCDNVKLRPEIRHQFAPGGLGIGLKSETTIFGMDGILTY